MSKTLIIITGSAGEYGEGFWNFDEKEPTRHLEIDQSRTAIIIKGDDRDFPEYGPDINELLKEKLPDEVGIIIHFLDGDSEAASLSNDLPDAVKARRKFCDWYSTRRTGFWDELPHKNRALPYNAFREAVESGVEKAEAFERVWDFFLYDPTTEAGLGLIQAILNEKPPASEVVKLLREEVDGFDGLFDDFVRALTPGAVEGRNETSDFNGRFEELKQSSGDIFSTQYQTAYEKLRDALGVE